MNQTPPYCFRCAPTRQFATQRGKERHDDMVHGVRVCKSPRVKGGAIRCELAEGHPGPHFARIEHTTTWPQRKGV